MLVCAIAFSNIQRVYRLPSFLSAVIAEIRDLDRLTGIRKKEDFRLEGSHVEEPFDLSQLEDAIKKHTSLMKNITVKAFEPENRLPKKKGKSDDRFQSDIMTAVEIK
ncbi:MAG: hypothetical protein ACREBU_26580, partial [Nitrososphaera sp.]